MAGPQIDIQAQTQSAEAAIRRLTDAFNRLGQAAAGVTRTKFQLINPEELGQLSELEEKLRQVMQMHPSIRSAVQASNQNPATPGSINWANVPLTPGQTRTLMGHLSGGANRFVSGDDPQQASRIGESIARAFGRFFGGMGGGVGQVGSAAANGAVGGAGGFSGMGLLRGGLLGAGLFGAYKAGQMVMEGYDNARTLAIEMDKLKRQMGDIGVSFGVLQSAAQAASEGLEINAVEAGKLMSEFNHLSGGVKDSVDLMEGTRAGVGMSKALGLDPSAGVGFLANIRNITRGGSADGDRRLALMIGDVVTRSGMNGRADEILQAIQSFAAATSRISLSNPNLGAFSGLYSGMLSSRIPGMTPETAAAMIGQANSAVTNMGAFGEASETFTMAALSRDGRLNPIQARVLAEGGLFGGRAGAFGKNSVYRQYMMANGVAESEVDKLMAGNSGRTNFEEIRRQLDEMNVDPHIKAEMAKNYFGLSSINQAMAFMTVKPEEMGKTERLLGERGIDLKDYNETGIMTLSKIANAGKVSDLQNVAADMMGREGKGALSTDEKARLAKAIEDAKRLGGNEGFAKLQDVLTDLAADKDKQQTLGSQMVDQQKRIENAMIEVGKGILGPLTDIKEVLMAGFKVSETKAREQVRDIRKTEINEEFNKKRKAVDAKFQDAVDKLPGRSAWGSVTPEWIEANKRLQEERNKEMIEIEKERAERLGKVDSDYANDEKNRIRARDAQRQAEEGSGGEGAARPMTRTKREFVEQHRAGAEAAGRELGVDPKLLLAQAGLETGWGRSVIPGTNNLGNIKAGRSWTGETKRAYDKAEGSNDEYRVYDSTDDYWKDYVRLMRRKYPGVVGVGSDSKEFARVLKDGGYATDPFYESKLINSAKGVDMADYQPSTPLPYNNFSLTNGVQRPVMINGEFKLIGADNMPKAMPLFISKEVPMPSPTGSRK